MLRRVLRRLLPLQAKRLVGGIIAGNLAGACIRRFSGGVLTHRNARVCIDHPRVTNTMVAQLYWKIYERAELDQITRFLPRDADVLEVGGSSGITTLLLASLLNPERKIVSVEADPELSSLAAKNCRTNGLAERVTFVSAAVDYENAQVSFHQGSEAIYGRIEKTAGSAGTISVPATTLSQLAAQHGLRDYTLVMDIEGAEWEVLRHGDLRGARRILAELHEIRTPETTLSVPELLREFEKSGFRLVDQDTHCVVLDRS
jgi:FkbM family methyltransferase